MAAETILLIDDDPVFRAVVGEMLRLEGHACSEAEDGAAGIACLERAMPDLVVLDMIMPTKEGIETLREIKTRWPRLLVIAVSGGTSSMGADMLLRMAHYSGADAVMTKPLRTADFVPTVRRLLDARDPADLREKAKAALLRRVGR